MQEFEEKLTELLGLNNEVKYKIISGVEDCFFGCEGEKIYELLAQYNNSNIAKYSIQSTNSEESFESNIIIKRK